jgi:DNA repair ATPase RecN
MASPFVYASALAGLSNTDDVRPATAIGIQSSRGMQGEDQRLAAWARAMDAEKKELLDGKRKLKEDLNVVLETKEANGKAHHELQEREKQLADHEAELHAWRAAMKADVAKQVSEQESSLQVRRAQGHDHVCL